MISSILRAMRALKIWQKIIERFEQQAPGAVMAHPALDRRSISNASAAAVPARKMAERLPVSLAELYAKVQRTEPVVLRALVQGSAERLVPVPLMASGGLPGWPRKAHNKLILIESEVNCFL